MGGLMMLELMFLPHGESYKCAEDESAFALPVFIVRLLFITSTDTASVMFPDWDIVTLVDLP